MNNIIQNIQKELKENIDAKTKNSFQRFFKEEVKCYEVKLGIVNKIAKNTGMKSTTGVKGKYLKYAKNCILPIILKMRLLLAFGVNISSSL